MLCRIVSADFHRLFPPRGEYKKGEYKVPSREGIEDEFLKRGINYIQLLFWQTLKIFTSRWLHSGGSPVEPECGTSQKGSTALTGLWNQHFLKLRLLFWKTLEIIVRFLALIFGDSLENFLIFTKLGKDSVFVCNNFQKFPLCKRGLGGFLKG